MLQCHIKIHTQYQKFMHKKKSWLQFKTGVLYYIEYTVTVTIQKSCDWANQIKEMNSIYFLFVQNRTVKFLMRECIFWICDGCLLEKKRAWDDRLTLKRLLNVTVLIPSDFKQFCTGGRFLLHLDLEGNKTRPNSDKAEDNYFLFEVAMLGQCTFEFHTFLIWNLNNQ